MKIAVKALPVREIIEDLSRQFETPVIADSRELTIEIPQEIGQGYIRGTSFDSGIGLIDYKCTFYQDFELLFSINKTHPLKFIFCSIGRVDHTFENEDELHSIDTYQNIIVSSSGKNGHALYFKANEPVHVSSLEIIRIDLAERNNYDFQDLDEELIRLFKDIDAEEKFFYQGNYSIKTADIVEEINNKEFTGFLRSIFLEGKLFEMLVLQINQFHDDNRQDKLPQILRRSDVEKVKQAVELINKDLSQNHSVDYLAKEVGTNVNKLQEAFKHTFGLTVNKYEQQIKLDAAKEMLTSSENNISEIVCAIGLNNRSYFSKVFKEKYGVSPKYFRKSERGKEV